MKTCVMGYSGAGKSTLAAKLAKHRGVPVLHLDTVHWMAGWKERDDQSKQVIVQTFLEENTSWVIDGEYGKLFYEERLEQADEIILLLLSRRSALLRVIKRYAKYHGRSRPDMAEGCMEKLDWAFVKWVLVEGRTKQKNLRHKQIMAQYPQKTVVLRNQRQINRFEQRQGLRRGET